MALYSTLLTTLCKFAKILRYSKFRKGITKLSIKTELVSLKHTKTALRRRRVTYYSKIKNLERIKSSLESSNTSSLAQMEENQKLIQQIEREIRATETVFEELGKKISVTQRQIDEREQTPNLYIQEQVEKMFSKFMEYIEEHMEDITSDGQRMFEFGEIRRLRTEGSNSYYIPIGNCAIINDNSDIIAENEEFYFKNVLFRVKTDGNGAVYSKNTHWYNQYLNDFRKAFFKKLKSDFRFYQIFNLTIEENSKFTLELV